MEKPTTPEPTQISPITERETTGRFPQRVVCLTEETTETLYELGLEHLIVGISGFTVRPVQARKEKPKVSTYLDANVNEIVLLEPDVVFAWSDLQAGICEKLIREGLQVVCFNHRSVEGILSMIEQLTSILGYPALGRSYVSGLEAKIQRVKQRAALLPRRPRVYFEEWYDPLISGIRWVSELIDICGGVDIFQENAAFPDAKRRILASDQLVIPRSPDTGLFSWCGKPFKEERVLRRSGWQSIPAVQERFLYEIHSSVILQPGPAALTEGIDIIDEIIQAWANESLQPSSGRGATVANPSSMPKGER